MKRIIAILLVAFAITYANAQTMSVASFRALPNDMDARVGVPKLDQNNQKAAIIKVQTTEQGFTFECGLMNIVDVVNHTGEIWVYVPHSIQKLTIKHPKLGVLRDYYFPERIKEASVYELALTTAKLTTIIEDNPMMQYLTIHYTPEDLNVDIYIDEQYMQGSDGTVSKVLPYGEHTYRIEAPNYKTAAGVVEIGAESEKLYLDLQPLGRKVYFTTAPEEGAEVYLNGKLIGTTPFVSEILEPKEYKLQVKSKLYLPFAAELAVEDNAVTDTVSCTLKPNFGELSVNCAQETNIFINGEDYGTNPQEVRLTPGFYTVETKKQSHHNQKEIVEIVADNAKTLTLGEPVAKYGSADITTNVIESVVYIDGEKEGESPIIITGLLEGNHEVEIRKDGYRTHYATIEVEENKTAKYSAKLVEGSDAPSYDYIENLSWSTTPKTEEKKERSIRYGAGIDGVVGSMVGYSIPLEVRFGKPDDKWKYSAGVTFTDLNALHFTDMRISQVGLTGSAYWYLGNPRYLAFVFGEGLSLNFNIMRHMNWDSNDANFPDPTINTVNVSNFFHLGFAGNKWSFLFYWRSDLCSMVNTKELESAIAANEDMFTFDFEAEEIVRNFKFANYMGLSFRWYF